MGGWVGGVGWGKVGRGKKTTNLVSMTWGGHYTQCAKYFGLHGPHNS